MAKNNEGKEARGFLKGALLLIPNFLKLLVRLFKDKRVPMTEKALVIGAIIYVISPLDFIPDVIPFVGQIDDLYLVALTVLRLLRRTDETVIYEHWDGPGNPVVVLDKIERAARYVLPKRVQQVLLGRVEIAPKINGGLLVSPADGKRVESIEERRRKRN